MQITLKRAAGKHQAGTHLRVWHDGPVEPGLLMIFLHSGAGL